MYMLLGGYKCRPERIQAWFTERGVQLKEGFYMVLGNRYLRKENFQCRIRSCDYEGQHCFLLLTHKMSIHDVVFVKDNVVSFEEDDQARSIKKEMGLEDLDFVNLPVYIGCR